ncbi:MAG: hypothetical protein CSA39_02275 [Flavobacteriales bacterium]|nr:MAG: hypothetical protein CSA39_02275 [Flavobacteriales bacterium]
MIRITSIILVIIYGMLYACNQPDKNVGFKEENWNKRSISLSKKDSLVFGKTYLAVYSEIFSHSEHTKYGLTAMVSLRNISDKDSVYILSADYYNTSGDLLRRYFQKPIFLRPLETVEIIIDEADSGGGTGANFIFEWKTPKDTPEPFFEGVMNSTMGQQGLSFTTQGRRIE